MGYQYPSVKTEDGVILNSFVLTQYRVTDRQTDRQSGRHAIAIIA